MEQNNTRVEGLTKINEKLREEYKQFSRTNTTLIETSEGVEKVLGKSSEYEEKIKDSETQISLLVKKHRKEKYFLYICFGFYMACFVLICIRRIPIILLLKWIYQLILNFL